MNNHSEDYCHRCGGPNTIWDAPSPLWNEVMRGGDINGNWQFDEIICPTCFMILAEKAGIATGFRVVATQVKKDLQTVTPSGRVWDEKEWMWVYPPKSESQILKEVDAIVGYGMQSYWDKGFEGSCPCFSGKKVENGKAVNVVGRCWRTSVHGQDLYVWGDHPDLVAIGQSVKRALDAQD